MRTEDLRLYLQSCGVGVHIRGLVTVTDPRSVVIGNRVIIEPDGWFASEGGLTLGDGSYIGHNVRVETVRCEPGGGRTTRYVPSAVAIGRNVHVGARALLLPGVRIGDGAVISPGAVVSQDVPPGSVASPASARVTAWSGAGHSPQPGGAHWCDPSARVFFIVGSGRSGTLTIARLLSQHPLVNCMHELRPQMIALSTEFAHGVKTAADVRRELRAVFCESSTRPADRVSGESDQKYWNLIPMLAELMPGSQFIWLIRDGRDVVASTFSRGWYRADGHQGDPLSLRLGDRHAHYRLDGGKCGAFASADWERLSAFEKNCWHWTYVNDTIGRLLSSLPQDRWVQVRVEDLRERKEEVFRFLGVHALPVKVEVHNRTAGKIDRWSQWPEERREQFERQCGEAMDLLYPLWREDTAPLHLRSGT
jgi:hypothetical protein